MQVDREANGYKHEPLFRTLKELQRFTQDKFPASPKPKQIKHVVMDADDTIWNIIPSGIASLCEPIGKTDGDILPTRCGDWGIEGELPSEMQGIIRLDSTLRSTLNKLKEKGIPVSIASTNFKDDIMRFLDAFGLAEHFRHVEASMDEPKSNMVKRIAEEDNIKGDEILFVDDSYDNAIKVSESTKATSLIKGWNIKKISDILEFIE